MVAQLPPERTNGISSLRFRAAHTMLLSRSNTVWQTAQSTTTCQLHPLDQLLLRWGLLPLEHHYRHPALLWSMSNSMFQTMARSIWSSGCPGLHDNYPSIHKQRQRLYPSTALMWSCGNATNYRRCDAEATALTCTSVSCRLKCKFSLTHIKY